MEQYIPKSALVAEIERICAEEKALFDEQCQGGYEPSPSPAVVCMKMECLLSFINTLEVKEMKEEPVSSIWHDSNIEQPSLSPSKEQWISDTIVKLIASIPYEYVTSGAGYQTMEPRHIYAARIAKEMADVIFGE